MIHARRTECQWCVIPATFLPLVQVVPASIKMCASMEGPGPYGSEYDCTDMITLNSYCCEPHCLLSDLLLLS